jgi:hypothetical protein
VWITTESISQRTTINSCSYILKYLISCSSRIMSWTQVYVSGIGPSVTVDEFELALSESLLDESTLWAGPGTSILKHGRSEHADTAICYCFLAFHLTEGALTAVERINNYDASDTDISTILSGLHAELSQPKTKKKGGKNTAHTPNDNTCDVRLRRRRKQPAPKHPVIISSAPAKK